MRTRCAGRLFKKFSNPPLVYFRHLLEYGGVGAIRRDRIRFQPASARVLIKIRAWIGALVDSVDVELQFIAGLCGGRAAAND
jgi:hypothetical protein